MDRREFMPLFKTPIILNLLVLPILQVVIFEGGAAAATITRDDFPPGFIFGAGSSAYQVEGAAAEDGRKPSIWDTFSHAGLNMDKRTGDVAADQYHKYKEDVKLMRNMGLDAYRFSISWSRLIPDGSGNINPKGLQYYNNLIDELVGYGIEPHVTLYHFDFPQALEDEYGGLLSPKVVDDFTAYANVCFKEFGDRVKYWITFNEPNLEAVAGYDIGIFPPARCSYPYGLVGVNCSEGDSTKEPYLFAHNVLLSHASAASLYKDKYQVEQGGQVGITILGFWFKPFTNSLEDRVATNRAIDFHIGWFMDPLVYGSYPATMREIVGKRLPSFDEEESKKLKESFDFIGVNHYSVFYLQSYPNNLDANHRDYVKDVSVKLPSKMMREVYADFFKGDFGKVFTTREMPPMPSTPWALQELLDYIKVKYGNPSIIIHENGYGEYGLGPTSRKGTDDARRANFLQGYLEGLLQSIRNGSNTHGYFVWSFMDCFELMFGYTARFGLYGVDFKRADRRRFPRLSAQWYSHFLNDGGLRSRASNIIHIE